MRLPHKRSSNASAPVPRTSSFEKLDWSNSAADSRHGRASTSIAGDQFSPAHPRGRSDSSPPSAFDSYQLTRSQPPFSPNTAPSSRWRAYADETRNGRPACRSSPGYLTSKYLESASYERSSV